ncbi:MAG: hypothetical protein ABSC23_10880 [Bryobacteraceae bacterium]|jgi:anti-sigma28 factor (negative regulator of flagellin synthesis)
MKIPDQNLTNLAAAGSRRTEETRETERQRSASEPSSAAGGGDRVEFSAALGQLARAISAYGADRTSRVQTLAALYQSGGYRSDSAATSRAMVSEALSGVGQ